jgi:chromosomal replication initiator protein
VPANHSDPPAHLWQTVLALLRSQHDPGQVEVWIAPLECRGFDGAILALRAPSDHHASYVRDFWLGRVVDAATEVWQAPVAVLVDHGPLALRVAPPAPPPVPVAAGIDASKTFENFVRGSCNEFAYSAAINAAGGIDASNNPLLIYAPTGCGKTHLLNAIGNRVLKAGKRVLYVTSESFVNDMIRAIQHKQMEEFRAKYRRSYDYLLIDDVQFLAGKERTQEEFFHTFNELIAAGGYIALTSDVPPSEIPGLEDRLRTRFVAGLQADIGPTDPETMRAIINQKAAEQGVELPPEASTAIAARFKNSVREAEGSVKKLCALHAFYKQPITDAFMRNHMTELFLSPQRVITCEHVIEVTARYHGIKAADLTGPSKTKTLTRPRHIAMALARELTRASFPEIGKAFGNRDHSTIQHACKKVAHEINTDTDLRTKMDLIRDSLTRS